MPEAQSEEPCRKKAVKQAGSVKKSNSEKVQAKASPDQAKASPDQAKASPDQAKASPDLVNNNGIQKPTTTTVPSMASIQLPPDDPKLVLPNVYDEERRQNIRKNKAALDSLGIQQRKLSPAGAHHESDKDDQEFEPSASDSNSDDRELTNGPVVRVLRVKKPVTYNADDAEPDRESSQDSEEGLDSCNSGEDMNIEDKERSEDMNKESSEYSDKESSEDMDNISVDGNEANTEAKMAKKAAEKFDSHCKLDNLVIVEMEIPRDNTVNCQYDIGWQIGKIIKIFPTTLTFDFKAYSMSRGYVETDISMFEKNCKHHYNRKQHDVISLHVDCVVQICKLNQDGSLNKRSREQATWAAQISQEIWLVSRSLA